MSDTIKSVKKGVHAQVVSMEQEAEGTTTAVLGVVAAAAVGYWIGPTLNLSPLPSAVGMGAAAFLWLRPRTKNL